MPLAVRTTIPALLNASAREEFARPWLCNQQVIQPDALRKAARIGDLNPVLMPLYMHRPESRVIAVNQGIGQTLTKIHAPKVFSALQSL